jgi:site-specific DNA-adenine methylase
LKTAFAYFGNKSKAASEIWKRLGDVPYYYEPFAGTAAVLLRRPTPPRRESINDTDCQVTNFWRAAKFGNADDWARLAQWPSSQLDFTARRKFVARNKGRIKQGLLSDPYWFDLEYAAFWCWVQCCKIAINAKSIVMGRNKGIRCVDLTAYFVELKQRLKDVQLYYDNWTKLANDAARESKRCFCGIVLDPPYSGTIRQANLYHEDDGEIAQLVARWARAIATQRPKLRIALCGYWGEHKMPSDWEEFAWNSQMGMGRERIWFSPSCVC